MRRVPKLPPNWRRKGVGGRFSLCGGKDSNPKSYSRCRVRVEDSRPHRGFTLLEIILALAILAGSLAALGEVMRLADQNATSTRDETQAQILASSVMDELIAGVIPLAAINQSRAAVDSDPPWVYSIALEQTGYAELIGVRVLVEQQADPRLQPARFELVRWLPNPDYVPPSTSNQSSTGSSSQSSTGTSSGATTGAGGGQTGAGGQR
ncbi:MAG TPA: prepilin-type N-terminal cleavage/methylation domain-containing protein [Lacipirellulaceae bacterium]|jgi:type II secretion system protein I|nr:prepilin-type N-terminal cleavage/methylation domain-containing protein [Lacipirellulaceae bacterium]